MPWRNSPEDRAHQGHVYGTEYKRNRQLARNRARGYCEGCGHKHPRLQCDHIQNTAALGKPDHSPGNLRMLCTGPGSCKCHDRKTATEGGGYRQANSTPTDPSPAPRTAW